MIAAKIVANPVGVKQRAEAASHDDRLFMKDAGHVQAMFKLDFVNEFNAMSRDAILRTVCDGLPESVLEKSLSA